jgi:Chaperone of endosialidase
MMAGGYDASGIYSRWFSWQDDAANGIKIVADRHDTEDNEFANALTLCILKDGRSVISNNIPFNGKRIVNLADPDPSSPQDAATKNYVDTLTGWPKSKSISGTDADGRLNFTGTSGVNGITWTYADLSWVAKGAKANETPNRLVLNDKVDATGTDVFIVDEHGYANHTHWTQNASNDTGSSWRTPAAGRLSILTQSGGVWTWYTNYTATTSAYGPATLNTAMVFNGVAGILTINGPSTTGVQVAQFSLNKNKSGDVNRIAGYRNNSLRWLIDLGNATAEGGSNAGSDFSINRYSDTGASLGIGMTIDRSSGDAAFGGHINLLGNVNNNAVTTTHLFGNHRCKNGLNVAGGTYSADVFNMLYSGGMHLFVNSSDLGIVTVTSDYRIKKDVQPLGSTWDRVKALKPISYTQAEFTTIPSEETAAAEAEAGTPSPGPLTTADDIERWGFIAHETQETLLPTAASGEKDMKDGVQGLNWAPIVAALTKALQEAMTRIENLEGRLKADAL